MSLIVSSNILVFDLDDTLFPECSYVQSGFAAIDQWLLANHNISGFLARALHHYNAGVRGQTIDLALQDLKIFSQMLATKLVTLYREHRPSIALYPDARWALEHCGQSHSLGVLTDGWLMSQQNKVRALDLEKYVNHLVYSDALGRESWKPNVAPYAAIVERFACSHSDCVYIADNPQKDFVTARKLGWKTVRVVRPDGEYRKSVVPPDHDAHVTITSLYELKALLPSACAAVSARSKDNPDHLL